MNEVVVNTPFWEDEAGDYLVCTDRIEPTLRSGAKYETLVFHKSNLSEHLQVILSETKEEAAKNHIALANSCRGVGMDNLP